MQPGLTMVVGPPGTGKTDVAVQIISNLYHNFPGQRTLLVTHSNHALNDLFEKIAERGLALRLLSMQSNIHVCLDINERHLLRLGHGEAELELQKDFSKFGRVNFMLVCVCVCGNEGIFLLTLCMYVCVCVSLLGSSIENLVRGSAIGTNDE